MPTTIRVAIVAAALMGVLGAYAALSGSVESILILAVSAWIVLGTIKRDRSMQDPAFGFALIGSFTTGAPALLLIARGALEHRTDVFATIPGLAVQLTPFVVLAWCLSRPAADLWFGAGAPAAAQGHRRPVGTAKR